MTKKIKDLAPNPKNPRTITDERLNQLSNALSEFGDLSGFVFNRQSNQLVGGHQRAKIMPPEADIQITHRFKKPTKKGTIAYGYVLYRGERFSYREVEWDHATELAANIAANQGAGKWDDVLLSEMVIELNELEVDMNLTMLDPEMLEDLLVPSIRPNFEEGKEEDQGKLDEKKRLECPECGHRFVPGWS